MWVHHGSLYCPKEKSPPNIHTWLLTWLQIQRVNFIISIHHATVQICTQWNKKHTFRGCISFGSWSFTEPQGTTFMQQSQDKSLHKLTSRFQVATITRMSNKRGSYCCLDVKKWGECPSRREQYKWMHVCEHQQKNNLFPQTDSLVAKVRQSLTNRTLHTEYSIIQ